MIDFFFKNLEYLNSTTLNHIPFEATKSLEIVLKEWIPKSNNFIIVTSLSEKFDDFYFDDILSTTEDYYKIIKSRYQIEFNKKLIQITLPSFLSNDYLVAVILYHEIGHFVDIFHNISSKIEYEVSSDSTLENKLLAENILCPNTNYDRHIEEYFADVFAARYVGDSLVNYLMYYTLENSGTSSNYPSTTNRKIMVDDFLCGKGNIFLDLLKDVSFQSTNIELLPLDISLDISSFHHLLPEEIITDTDIHKLYPAIWSLWNNDWATISKLNSFEFDVDFSFKYDIINSLTEKTISNYIISSTWNDLDVSNEESNK